MRIVILTSCTGEKSVSDKRQLTLSDFRKGKTHIRARERELEEKLTPAEALYTGLQHQRLMRGIRAVRAANGIETDLLVLSAGYGLIPADRKLAPYEATFLGMKKAEAQAWAKQLRIAADLQKTLEKPYELGMILLGDDYLDACALNTSTKLGGPTILFCSKNRAKKLPRISGLIPIILTNADTKPFSCGLVGLKGEVAARILERLARDGSRLVDVIHADGKLLGLLAKEAPLPKTLRSAARANPLVDRVIEPSGSWRNKPHRKKLAYFIPEWDDLVDPEYDFETDTHSGGSGDWSNEVYAHQIYPEPNYDGILISKVVAEKSKKKAERINRLGVHRYLRVPRDFPIMGDCGAFGYINDEVPPCTTEEILDYYTRLDFDYGVSIDHFAIGDEPDRSRRYQLTIENARSFIAEHKKLGLAWTPIGAVQGWDEDSFAKAARQYVGMGYKYIALGAMVRRRTPEILAIVQAVRKVIPSDIRVHLFGVARLNAIQDLIRVGISSADSAACLRNAWMGTGKNYLTIEGRQYSAIRVPQAETSFRAKRMVSEGRASLEKVRKLDKACINALHAYDRDRLSMDTVLDVLHEYDQLITPDRPDNKAFLRRTLEAKPWKSCSCDICLKDGIDVIIFRGNNRNRRRGFHNTYAFYKLFQRVVAGEIIELIGPEVGEDHSQLSLLEEAEVVA